MASVFTIQVPPIEGHPGGTLTLTNPRPEIYLLTINSPPDNRLTTPMCHTLRAALIKTLSVAQQQSPPGGVLLITSSNPKFFSNGLDLDHVMAVGPDIFFPKTLYPLFKAFLTFPLPTVAVINGHGFAGGLMLAMMCDYRVMNPKKGFVCLNEIHFGAHLKAPMTSIFREKCEPRTYRSVVLEGKRFPGPEALERGIVDGLGGMEEALDLVVERKLLDVSKTGVFAVLRGENYRQTMEFLTPESYVAEERNIKTLMERDEKWRAEAKGGKAKL
jgi:enoyl-CoA hydratase/carnithine racemase